MKKVAFYTLGCKLNFSETSSVARLFQEKGYERVDFDIGADIFVINTCSVTENADKKCSGIVNQARKKSPNAFIAIMGCFAQLKPKEIATIPGVDAVLGAAEKFRLLDLIKNFEKQPETLVYASDVENAKEFHSAYSINDRTRTFLKVQDGCDYSCTFCTIPLARGKSRSDVPENVVQKAKEIAHSGVREIVLTGVNTGDYGIINGKREYRFPYLVEQLDQVSEIDRLRISSIEPNLLTDEIIDIVGDSDRFMPHFHIPLQSGSDEILKKMKRRYLTALYTSRIEKIRDAMPHACIGVDVITGFPGETEKEFLQTYTYLNELDISYLHVFTYSERANTPATKMEGSVPLKIRQERSKMLRGLSEKKRRFFYEQHLGTTRPVLFEHAEKGSGLMEGFTDNYIRIQTPYDASLVNKVVDFELNRISENGNVEGSILKMAVI